MRHLSSLLLVLCLALLGCPKKAPPPAVEPGVLSFYDDWDAEWGQSDHLQAWATYTCRLQSSIVNDTMTGIFGAVAEGRDPSSHMKVDVVLDKATYWACMDQQGYPLPEPEPELDEEGNPLEPDPEPEINADGTLVSPELPDPEPAPGHPLLDLATCWRLPDSTEPCWRAFSESEAMSRDSETLWYVQYNALAGACVLGDTEACSQRDGLEEAIEAFDRRQVELRVSGVDHYDLAEAPPQWDRVGAPAWRQQCLDGCPWCCVLSARWEAWSLRGKRDAAQGYLDKACTLSPDYCPRQGEER